MSTRIITSVYSSLLAALLTTGAMAQDVKPLPPVVVTSASNVNEKVANSFKGSFKDAIDPVWYRLDKNYLVKFIMNDQKNTALFQKNGKLIYNISYGSEKDMPAEISDLVNGRYGDYKILMAIHVNEENRSIWVVNLEGLKKLIVVRVEDGELEEVGNYVKG
jgi:hypothetical protein